MKKRKVRCHIVCCYHMRKVYNIPMKSHVQVYHIKRITHFVPCKPFFTKQYKNSINRQQLLYKALF